MYEYVIVPESEQNSFEFQVDNLPTKQYAQFIEKYKVLVVPDALYAHVHEMVQSGKMNELLKQGPEALLHHLKLGQNAVPHAVETQEETREAERPAESVKEVGLTSDWGAWL